MLFCLYKEMLKLFCLSSTKAAFEIKYTGFQAQKNKTFMFRPYKPS